MACENDCNDDGNTIYPGAEEVCNTIDDNCEGKIDEGIECAYVLSLQVTIGCYT